MKPTLEQIDAACVAIMELRADADAERRRRSQLLFGHTGASIPQCHVTLQDEVKVALEAAMNV